MAILKAGSNIVPDMYVVSGQEGAKQMNEGIDLFIVVSFTLVNETRKCLFFFPWQNFRSVVHIPLSYYLEEKKKAILIILLELGIALGEIS